MGSYGFLFALWAPVAPWQEKFRITMVMTTVVMMSVLVTMIMLWVMMMRMVAATMVTSNLVVDLLYGVLDPRLRSR